MGEAVVKGHENAYLPSGGPLHLIQLRSKTRMQLSCAGQHAQHECLFHSRCLQLSGVGIPACSKQAFGTVPLYDAALGELTTVTILLARGAEIHSQERNQELRPSMWQHLLDMTVAALLLEKGADPNICSKEDVSPLHVALENGNESDPPARRRQSWGRDTSTARGPSSALGRTSAFCRIFKVPDLPET